MRCLAAIQGESATALSGTQRGIHRVRDNKTFDWTVLEETCYTCLAVAGYAVDLFVLDAGLFVPLPAPCHAPSLAVHKFESLLKAGFGFCSLLCRISLGCALPKRTMTKALVFGPCLAAVPVFQEPSH